MSSHWALFRPFGNIQATSLQFLSQLCTIFDRLMRVRPFASTSAILGLWPFFRVSAFFPSHSLALSTIFAVAFTILAIFVSFVLKKNAKNNIINAHSYFQTYGNTIASKKITSDRGSHGTSPVSEQGGGRFDGGGHRVPRTPVQPWVVGRTREAKAAVAATGRSAQRAVVTARPVRVSPAATLRGNPGSPVPVASPQ